MKKIALTLDQVFRCPAQAAAGLVVSVVIAESLLALSLLFGVQEHLLWAATRPEAATTAAPAQLSVIWLVASAAGASLAASLDGRISAGLPAGMVPAASLILMSWYFRQPTTMTAVLATGPVIGCLLGILSARALARQDARTA